VNKTATQKDDWYQLLTVNFTAKSLWDAFNAILQQAVDMSIEQNNIVLHMHTLVVVARLLYVFVYSLTFCISCTISIINKICLCLVSDLLKRLKGVAKRHIRVR